MTNLLLLNVPFESDYKDTIYFPNLVQQVNYMRSRKVHTFTDFTYQRKDNIIRIPAHIDTLYNCNYVMYQNEFSKDENTVYNKWMYAFIVDMQYINDERTDVTIKTDVLQTWMFDYTVKPSFVEREHVNDDTIGLHTVPEGLETGDFICNSVNKKKSLINQAIIVGATIDLSKEGFPNVPGQYYNGVYSGVKYFRFPRGFEDLPGSIDTVIEKILASEGKSDAINCIFMAPETLLITTVGDDGVTFLDETFVVNEQEWQYFMPDSQSSDLIPERPIDINGYVPKNNKLFTHPYCYLLADNNSGGCAVYKYELFAGDIDFKILSALTPGMSIRLLPKNYNGVELNNSEGLNLGKFPICSWNTDVYTNWLTQNSVNIGLNIASGVGQVVAGTAIAMGGGGLATAVGGGSIVGGVSTIANQLAQIHQMSFVPPSVQGNVNSGDVTSASGNLTFTLYQMSIKKEYAQIIDEYLSMFGYKVSRVKIPLANHRKSYWYTKTIDVNIDGAIPNKELQEIKDCYNRGVTFWRSSVVVGDYSADNSIE